MYGLTIHPCGNFNVGFKLGDGWLISHLYEELTTHPRHSLIIVQLSVSLPVSKSGLWLREWQRMVTGLLNSNDTRPVSFKLWIFRNRMRTIAQWKVLPINCAGRLILSVLLLWVLHYVFVVNLCDTLTHFYMVALFAPVCTRVTPSASERSNIGKNRLLYKHKKAQSCSNQTPWVRSQYKGRLSGHWNLHYKDNTVLRPS